MCFLWKVQSLELFFLNSLRGFSTNPTVVAGLCVSDKLVEAPREEGEFLTVAKPSS